MVMVTFTADKGVRLVFVGGFLEFLERVQQSSLDSIGRLMDVTVILDVMQQVSGVLFDRLLGLQQVRLHHIAFFRKEVFIPGVELLHGESAHLLNELEILLQLRQMLRVVLEDAFLRLGDDVVDLDFLLDHIHDGTALVLVRVVEVRIVNTVSAQLLTIHAHLLIELERRGLLHLSHSFLSLVRLPYLHSGLLDNFIHFVFLLPLVRVEAPAVMVLVVIAVLAFFQTIKLLEVDILH